RLIDVQTHPVLLRERLKNESGKYGRRPSRDADRKKRTDSRKDSGRKAADADRLWFYELFRRQGEHVHRTEALGADGRQYVSRLSCFQLSDPNSVVLTQSQGYGLIER